MEKIKAKEKISKKIKRRGKNDIRLLSENI
jgi:hypothetical protein